MVRVDPDLGALAAAGTWVVITAYIGANSNHAHSGGG